MTFVESVRRALNSPAFKFLIVLILILALTIPLLFVYGLVYEREQYAAGATREIGEMWGGEQSLSGPFLVVPTEQTAEVAQTLPAPGGVGVAPQAVGMRTETVRRLAVFLPETLNIEPNVETEVRHRGIFEVPVYTSQIRISGTFLPPDQRSITGAADRILWSEAVLVGLVQQVRGIKTTADIRIGTAAPEKFRAGVGLAGSDTLGIHVPISESIAQSGFSFDYTLALNGSRQMQFTPSGGETSVKMQSDWPHPSFEGAFLPDARSISADGFTAEWAVPRLARGQGQVRHVTDLQPLANEMRFGVSFFQPVHFYSLAERALKYALGFITVVFFAAFIMEMQTRQRVHWIQYLFVGIALVIFYVLLIGTSEHIGFDLGYLAAATATSLLIGTYFGMLFRSAIRGLALTSILGLIYGLLYLLLRLEDYALLVGSIAAFVLIATVMFTTRRVDWSSGAPDRAASANAS